MRLPFKVVAKIPEVEIKEPSFDFGKLTTLGTAGTLPFTLVNRSGLNSVLILDLRDAEKHHGIDCLDIEFLGSNSEKQFKPFEPIENMPTDNANKEEKQESNPKNDQSIDKQSVSDDDVYQEEQVTRPRLFKINLPETTELYFNLSFITKEIIHYSFPLPLSFLGLGAIPSIQRTIKA